MDQRIELEWKFRRFAYNCKGILRDGTLWIHRNCDCVVYGIVELPCIHNVPS